MEGFPVAAYHLSCGGIAFWMKQRPTVGSALKADDVVMPDGQHAINGTQVVCGSCGKPMPISEILFDEPKLTVLTVTQDVHTHVLVSIANPWAQKIPLAHVRRLAIEAAIRFNPDLAAWKVGKISILKSFDKMSIEFKHPIQEED